MKKFGLLVALALVAGIAHGQININWPSKPDQPNPEKVTFIAVMGVRVADPSRSYLMVCGPDRPDCNTVYEIEYRYIPFVSKEEVEKYLNSTKDLFVRLLTVQTASVDVKESVKVTHHPDTEERTTKYLVK